MFFDDSWSKYLIVAFIALIVIGPKEMPAMLRMLGRLVGKLRRHAEEFRRQFDESMREAGGDELKRELDQLRQHNPLNQIKNTFEDAAREVTHPPLSFDPPATPPASATTDTAVTEPASTSTPAAAPAAQDAAPAQSASATPATTPSDTANAPAQPHVNGAERTLQ
jgi:sec-independent protein translocase protein TatB